MSSQSIQKKIEDLTRQMTEAAAAEDYERAADLRNQIEGLKGTTVRKPPPGQMGLGTELRHPQAGGAHGGKSRAVSGGAVHR